MDHVRERCVLLRACWLVVLTPSLIQDFGILVPESNGGGGGGGGRFEGIMTYGRTVTIVCDGQVIFEFFFFSSCLYHPAPS
jgi:hypothetical protein